MKTAIVCLDKTYLQIVRYLRESLEKYTPIESCKLVTNYNDQNIEDCDFYFIWNGINSSDNNCKNLFNHLILNTSNGKCCYCGTVIEDYLSYRTRRMPCPFCGRLASRSSNFIYIFSGNHLRDNASNYFRNQMAIRFWASVDADWSLFRCLVQSMTTIPHLMVMPQKIWRKPVNFTISHFSTPDEPELDKYLKVIKEFCDRDPSVDFNEDASKLHRTNLYIDQLHTGVLSQHAINAMSIGIPTISYVNKFYLSHYPKLPIMNTAPQDIEREVRYFVHNPLTVPIIYNQQYVNKWFHPKRVSMQWYHLSKFILQPDSFLDTHPELDINDIPAYWAFQGGY